jgi:hypothetical protein
MAAISLLVFSLVDEHPEHAADGLDFVGGTGLQNDAIGLQALLFADAEDRLGLPFPSIKRRRSP